MHENLNLTPETTIEEMAAEVGLDTREIILLLGELLPLGLRTLNEIKALPRPLSGRALGAALGRLTESYGEFVDHVIAEAND